MGSGYAVEYHVERYWREARLQRLAPVSQEMTCNFIAQSVLGLRRATDVLRGRPSWASLLGQFVVAQVLHAVVRRLDR